MIKRIPIERVETQLKTSKRIVWIFRKLLTVFAKSFWTCLYKVHNNLLSNFEKKSFLYSRRPWKRLLLSQRRITKSEPKKKFSVCTLDILFRQITTFTKIHLAFDFGLQTLKLKEFIKIFESKGLKSKNKHHTKFYECCDLTKKYI